MADHCSLCERTKEPSSEFCSFHNLARNNLEDAYSRWNEAYNGKLTKYEYYARLMALEETGQAVRRLIEYLRGKEAEN
jgi:hypothetical protein